MVGRRSVPTLDVAGNVAEWTSTKDGESVVVMGGNYQLELRWSEPAFDFDKVKETWRLVTPPTESHYGIGFRCVSDDKG